MFLTSIPATDCKMRNGGYVTLKEREDMVSSNPTLKKSWKSRLCGIQTSFAIFFILILALSITVEHHRISTLWAALDNLGRMSIEKPDRLTTSFKLNSSFKLNTSFNVDDNLDNMVIERRNILVDFQYGNGGYLDVWKDPKYTRYYVTPICEIVAESTKCLDNEYDLQHPYIVVLPIQLWNGKAAEMAALAITHKIRENSSSSGADVQPNDCRPLPIKSARLVTNTLLNFEVPSGFRPNVLAEGNAAKFYLYPKDKIMCQKIVTDVQQNPTLFLEKIDLYLEYTMTVGKQSKHEVIVTSESLTKSEAFSILNNTYENKNGTVYLTSSDMNKFSRDVLKTINIIDTSTADFISTEEENNLIKSLIQDLKDETTLDSKLPKGEWDSVFWSDLFTRPDIVTSYLANTFSYDQGKQQFIYDSKNETEFYGDLKDKLSEYSDKSWAGSASARYGLFSGGGKVSHTDIDDMKKDWENLTKMAQKGELHSNNMTEYLKQNNRTVQWTGEKFIPKGLDLHRVNTNKLLIRGQIFYQKIVMTEIPATVKNRIQTESGNSTPGMDFYEELIQLRNKTKDLQSKLDILKNQTSININNVKNELNNKISSDASSLKNEISRSKNETINKLVAEFLTKVDYERSLGVLPHEQSVKYDQIQRHRLCLALSAMLAYGESEIIHPLKSDYMFIIHRSKHMGFQNYQATVRIETVHPLDAATSPYIIVMASPISSRLEYILNEYPEIYYIILLMAAIFLLFILILLLFYLIIPVLKWLFHCILYRRSNKGTKIPAIIVSQTLEPNEARINEKDITIEHKDNLNARMKSKNFLKNI